MTTSPKPAFASKLKKLRTQRGLSQSQVAEQLGTDFRVVSRWERGLHQPTAYYRPKLCELFDTTLEELALAKPLPIVFLSYASAEQEFVDRLKLDLENREIAVWTNEEGKVSYVERREDLYKILGEEVQATILIASPDAREAYNVKQELEVAELCKCPVRVLWRAGKRRRDAIPLNQSAARFIDAVDVRDDTSYEAVIENFIANLSQLLTPLDETNAFYSTQKQDFEPRNPYKGLQAFHEEEKNDFFGRDRLTDELVDELEKILASGERARLLAVVGHSGSGKSSVVMAGLLPLLQQGELAESQEWIYLDPMTPGTNPVETLVRVLMKHLPERSIESIYSDLAIDKASGLDLLASAIAKQPDRRVVLVVNQFEELFTQTADEQIRTQFINLLVKACQKPDGPLLVILTLRADFYHKLMYHEELGKIIEKQSKLVFSMSAREIKAVIERPALLPDVRLTFESTLVEDLLSEVRGQSGVLPLLQFTLDQLFERRDGLQLTYSAYEAIGKVEGALAHYADQIHETLDEDKKQRMRNILLQMVQPGNGVADTRRMARRNEIGEEDWKLVLWLADKRLVVISTTTDGQEIAEIAHEALIQNWWQLQDWMKADRSFRAWQERLRSAIRQWEENSQDMGGLLRGMPLAEAKRWLNERDQHIIGKERDFLFRSILLESSELQQWVPRYGTVEEALAFITPHTSSSGELEKTISIDALRWLPHTNADNELYDLLLQLALEDPSALVRKKATQCICERGHASELAQLLAPKKLTKQKKQRLTKALASVRNVPKVGYELEKVLRYSKRRILFSAMLELINTYRNHFAIIMFFSYVIGQMMLLLINAVLPELLPLAENLKISIPNIDIPTLVGDIFRIVMTLAICLYIMIRRNCIDMIKLSVIHCIKAAMYFIIFFDVSLLIYSFIMYIFVEHGTLLSPHSISLIISNLLPDAIALPLIAQVFRTSLSSRGAIWKLLWTALVSIGLLIAIERIFVQQIRFVVEETPFFTSKSLSYDIFVLWESLYHVSSNPQSVFATLVVGVFAGFGSLLGLRFGFLSAFNTENKAKPHSRLSIMALLSRKRQEGLPIHGLRNRVDLQHILRALPKSFYLVILVTLLGPIFISVISHSLPQPLSSNKLYGNASWSTSQDDISFSPNGRLTAFTTDDGITVSNTMTGEPLYYYDGHPINTDYLSRLRPSLGIWSSDSTKLTATFKYEDRDGRTDYQEETWDATTGKTLYALPVHYKDYGAIQWSPNGKYIATLIDDGSVKVWDATSGELMCTCHSYSVGLNDISWSRTNQSPLSWSPDSTRIISGFGQIIDIWDIATRATLHIFNGLYIYNIVWSPNGRYIRLSYGDSLEILDAVSFKVLARLTSMEYGKIYWSPNSKYIAIVTSVGVKIWDVLSGNTLYTYSGHILLYNDYAARDIAWSPDSKRIASAGEDGSLQFWDATTGNNVNTYYAYPIHANYWKIIIGKDEVPQIDPLAELIWIPNSNNIIAVGQNTIYNWQIT